MRARLFLIGLSLLVLAFAPAPAAAQSAQSPELVRFDLNFPGGTVAEYVDAIRRAHPEANIVLAEEVRTYPAPSVELQNVDLRAAMSLMGGIEFTHDGRRGQLTLEEIAVAGAPDPIIKVTEFGWGSEQPKTRESVYGRSKSHVWSLRPLIVAEMNPEDILTAIQAGLALDANAPEVELKFHEATALLLARGPEAQLGVIEEIIDRLRADAHEFAAGPSSEEAALRKDLESMRRALEAREIQREREILTLERELSQARSELDQTRARLTAHEQAWLLVQRLEQAGMLDRVRRELDNPSR